nr:hypothetical protein [Rhizobium sp. T1473]MCA0806411.1 hypothetical protein [Rhizobium sp. T1473]
MMSAIRQRYQDFWTRSVAPSRSSLPTAPMMERQPEILLATRFGEIVEVIIPPPKTAVASPQSVLVPSVRDRHIAEIQTKGRMAWQKSAGYNKRSRAETQMGRWKAVIGPKVKARHFDNQKTEAKIGVRVLNRMTELGRPKFERVA